ncbi:acetyl-CoA carboxylase biotin carboxyl carrier protein [Marchantia polymorpha subsp. ruderalis]|uniref:Biotin carboxyl carrier protein of acetyl-CoA carboxylase n=2 Tax=Marchantia polymorpha TaxID=3197 RepID=A0A176VKB0_MARPO|nr:hypothetical protein AXG93_3932s1090 [Marchantia polymorpha subsp. ruderalis]PTQ34251.1 hypothetical protein MARPO_0082s0078 [Marchantia polymorpha]BBN02503.1 hypothetical protein Mp_2g15830 [Marchantia polymorpha subsp. ruderalis]|eukprot:PTQ34251.1 hypothetical protein MARPO_0082s0078 [Marchantia polymorpha]
MAAAAAAGVSGVAIASGCRSRGSSSANPRVVLAPGLKSFSSVSISSSVFLRSRSFNVSKDNAYGITTSATKLEVAPVVEEEKEVKAAEIPPVLTPEASVASFMTDVANLVKLVDSRDIVELEMKHKDYEIIIRKKEALPPPPAPQMSFPGPHVMAHTSFPGYPAPPMSPPPAAAAAPAPAEIVPAAPAAPSAPPASLHPPMLSPMAGTFYRSPAPGEKAFVQVGDKVTKGQVVCIVEAMKLMNEIEADQSGTIVEIVAEDGKPVSIESPLFVIKP